MLQNLLVILHRKTDVPLKALKFQQYLFSIVEKY